MPLAAMAQGLPGGFRPPWPDDRTPVQLRLPPEIALFATSSAAGVSVSTRLALPAMGAWPAGAPCQGFCAGVVLLVVRTGEASELYHDVWALRRAMAREASAASPRAVYTPIQPIQGFTEAWQEESRTETSLRFVAVATTHHLRGPADGPPVEYVRCVTRWSSGGEPPRCTAVMTLDGAPAVQISATFNMQHLPEHTSIRAGLMRLVSGWR
jgi:hypothetical protein